jgi:ectoine hydroxylase-related dioxygenase (phytanoyl-CoA dioxygenase family)
MIETHVPEFASEIDAEQTEQIIGEGFLAFARCLDDAQLAAARKAYERTYEALLIGESEVAEGRIEYVSNLEQWCDKPDLVSLIGNPTIHAVARAACQSDEIEYTGSILRRTSMLQNDICASGATWHADSFIGKNAAPGRDDRVAIWFYFDDVTGAEGATEMVPGTYKRVQQNFIDGKEGADGLHETLVERNNAAPEDRVYAAAPAGGGMAFKSFVFHRATPNTSGIIRRVMTMDFRVKGTTHVDDGNFATLPREKQEAMRDMLPEASRHVIVVD